MSKEETMTQFWREVSEQPACLRKLAAYYRGPGKARLAEWARLAKAHRRVVFSGMGTSEFAPESITGALAREGIDAATRDAGEWLHYPRLAAGLSVLISQSGESVETRKLAIRLKNKPLAAITNNEASSLGRAAQLVLPMMAGHETAISTKTYVNTLAVLYLMARVLEGPASLERGLARLEEVADAMPGVGQAAIDRAAKLLAGAPAVHFIARGPALVAAKQAALTFMEGARVAGAAYAGGAFRHGPFELADKNLHCVLFISKGPTRRLVEAVAAEVAAKGGRVVVITDTAVKVRGTHVRFLKVSACGEDLFSLSAATTQELLLHAVAAARGIEAGRFRYGQKITARE